ncbi:2-oxo acid dehydrogenase subunit E2 [Martelella lutilitoris]|uniref:Dihydrolipoyllysine-residue acetyltransferase component of pyruvate dehydrogenase complex n=1 Tax=Martelella lutilitoris TaxID=2583532 RepID=A0A7T7KKU6_9HYPH|nr:2-oxo acid dehydrogenase subunit E2 [Martelella lutilitoris]QQM30036.1 2-oxo acid dehydrogenase subunit E2 [Martelella lutilitoris]
MSDKDFIASPAVVAYAGRKGVDLSDVARKSGRTNLAREDVDQHMDGSAPVVGGAASADDRRYWDIDHAAYGSVSEEPVTRIASLAADNLSAANRMIPQVTHHDRADMRAVETFRKSLRAEAEAKGLKLTALAFHVKALTLTLAAFPPFNASLSADGKALIRKNYVHIGIAVDTPHGLMVPVIRDADRKGLWQISAEIADLARRAGERKLRPDEMGGASMSVSNLGGIGGTAFTPLVNPPEVAILGIARAETVPVWENEAWQPVLMAPLDLSYDHRVINGADAARFLSHYARLLADPRRMLLA